MTTLAAQDRAPLPEAVLWDFDGTLADSEPLWMAAEYALAERLGETWSDEHARALVGNSLIDSGRYIASVWGRTQPTPEDIVDILVADVNDQLRAGKMPWRPGALELLADLRAAGVPCALVSASYRSTLEAVVGAAPEGTFATVVAGDEVTHGKPHPEPYLTACQTLGVDPARCVVVEDSVPGANSGNASGAVVLAVRNHVALPEAPRRKVVDSLVGFDAAALGRLVTELGGAA